MPSPTTPSKSSGGCLYTFLLLPVFFGTVSGIFLGGGGLLLSLYNYQPGNHFTDSLTVEQLLPRRTRRGASYYGVRGSLHGRPAEQLEVNYFPRRTSPQSPSRVLAGPSIRIGDRIPVSYRGGDLVGQVQRGPLDQGFPSWPLPLFVVGLLLYPLYLRLEGKSAETGQDRKPPLSLFTMLRLVLAACSLVLFFLGLYLLLDTFRDERRLPEIRTEHFLVDQPVRSNGEGVWLSGKLASSGTPVSFDLTQDEWQELRASQLLTEESLTPTTALPVLHYPETGKVVYHSLVKAKPERKAQVTGARYGISWRYLLFGVAGLALSVWALPRDENGKVSFK